MYKNIKTIMFASSILTFTAQAEFATTSIATKNGKAPFKSQSGFYIGYKMGTAYIDRSGVDEDIASGFFLGYAFNSGFALEVEKLSFDNSGNLPDRSKLKDDISGTDQPYLTDPIDLSSETLGVYSAIRTGDNLFMKAKFGYVMHDMTNNIDKTTSDEDSISYGLGLGYKAKYFIGELEYTSLSSIHKVLTLGLAFKY